MSEQTRDKLELTIHDVKIYSEGLITAIQSKKIEEIEDYAKKMENLLKEILKYADIEKSQIKSKMTFKK